MIQVALHTGLRRGELIALQWDAVDLVAGRLLVKRNVWRGHFGTPKGGRSREVPLNAVALQVLKAHRHLRGAFVFCDATGAYLKNDTCRNAILRASKRAGLRPIGWHTAAQLRQPPRRAWGAAQGRPGAARARHHRDDDSLRPPQPGRKEGRHARALEGHTGGTWRGTGENPQ
jgi:integrase